MAKILITGVAGLFGAHLSRCFISKGYNVIGIDDLSGGYGEFVPKDIDNFYKFNLNDINSLKSVFELEKPDYVYHLAAYAAEGLSPFVRNFNYTNNVLCSINIINECIKNNVKKLIFTSSMAVYGEGILPFTENQVLSPEDPYGIAKYTVEQDIKQANYQFNLKYNIVRPHNVVGIYQNIWDNYRNVIGIWIRQVLNNEPVSIFGDGLQKRAFSDISFYMEPLAKLMWECDNEIFNLGADKEYRIIEVAELLRNVVEKYGYKAKLVHLEQRHEVKNAFCDHSKAKKLLDFEDKTDLEKVINDMFLWAKEQPNREVKKIPYEIEKGIYSYWK